MSPHAASPAADLESSVTVVADSASRTLLVDALRDMAVEAGWLAVSVVVETGQRGNALTAQWPDELPTTSFPPITFEAPLPDVGTATLHVVTAERRYIPSADRLRTLGLMCAVWRAEQRFAAAAHRLESAIALAPQQMLVVNAHGIIEESFGANVLQDHAAVRGTRFDSHINQDDWGPLWIAVLESTTSTSRSIDIRLAPLPLDSEPRSGQCRFARISRSNDDGSALFVVTVADITEEQRLTRSLLWEARRCQLTGLLNRMAAMEIVSDAIATQRGEFAIALLDMNQFKDVNSTFGHEAADGVLRQVADRITKAIGPRDLAARSDGDEFMVIFRDVTSQRDAEKRLGEVLAVFNEQFPAGHGKARLKASVGLLIHHNQRTSEEAIYQCDLAMHESKRLGTPYTMFTPALMEKVHNDKRLEYDLSRAIQNKELRLVYQPLVELRSGQIVGAEALLRWDHPQEGPIGPTRFVPLAEHLGIVDEIGEFVLRTAVAQLRAWDDEHGAELVGQLSVNISAGQLSDPNFVTLVTDVLEQSNIHASRVALEITESMLVENSVDITSRLLDLDEAGVRLDIDDFGTGYSALSYLARLPVHALKIDKSFVWGLLDDPKVALTVETVLALARKLRLKTIAEGVENEKHLEWLRSHGCDIIQGYLVAEPLPPEQMKELLLQRRRW